MVPSTPHLGSTRRVGRATRSAPARPAPADRGAHRLPVHRPRPPARRDPAPQRPAGRLRRCRAPRPRRRRPSHHLPPDQVHLGHRPVSDAGMRLQALMACWGTSHPR
jgi:hypothetical protein